MNKQLLKDAAGWGLVLWFIGYILGIVLFMIVPSSMIGWIFMPIGATLTVWAGEFYAEENGFCRLR